ncbi:MAG: VanW family protein [Clostridia bacterium]|nr:VanW family protein [Clostridia bacterium]
MKKVRGNTLPKEKQSGDKDKNDINSNPKLGKKKIIILSICSVIAIIIAILLITFTQLQNNPYVDGKTNSTSSEVDFYSELSKTDLSKINITDKSKSFVKGIKISGYDLSSKTYNEVYSHFEANIKDFVEDIAYIIDCEGTKKTLTKEDFVFNADYASVVDKAYAISTLARSLQITQLPKDTDLELKYEMEEESISMAIDKVAELVDDEATGVELVSFDPSASEGKQFVFKDNGGGKALDREDAIAKLTKLIKSGEKEGTVSCVKSVPEGGLIANDLNQKMKLISTFSTTSTNNSNANHNMELALSSVNGTLLNPGDTFSFNACTGDSNLTSLGYLPAGVIMNGRSAVGIGGGICQASTTIYNAGLRAGLTIVERYAHAWPSTYAQQGLDATIDYPNLDLKMKNNSSYPVYINCYMSGVTLTCNMYSVPSTEWDEITCDSWTSGYGAGGSWTVAASRTFWLNGKEVKTEALKSSSYCYPSSSSEDDDESSSSKSSSKKSSSSKPNSSSESSSDLTSSATSSVDVPVSSVPDSDTSSIVDITSDPISFESDVPITSSEEPITNSSRPTGNSSDTNSDINSDTSSNTSSSNTSADAP